jgi:hypothetical protein
MPLVVSEPTVPMSELAKTFHASDRASTVIGILIISKLQLSRLDIQR